MYARHLLSNIRFPVGMIHEDQAFVPEVCYSAKKIYLINSCHYYYRVDNQSISHSAFSHKRFDNIILMNSLILFFKQNREKDLTNLARQNRNSRLAMYTILAKKQGIVDIPKGCHMCELKAFRILRKELTYDQFTYHLGSLHPEWLRPYAYFRKIESVITRKPL